MWWYLLIPNDELLEADIPSGDAELVQHWQELALSFPGNQVLNYADLARTASEAWQTGEKPTGSLTELRTWLFFEQRQDYHTGGEAEILDYIDYLVGQIREAVRSGPAAPDPLDPPDLQSVFPTPRTASEAREIRWPWVSFNVPNRFRFLETPSLSPNQDLHLAKRHGVHYLLSRRGDEAGGAYSAMPFRDDLELETYIAQSQGD